MTAVASASADQLGFAGHQTFPFRYGWLKKAVDLVSLDGSALASERAMVDLGVGKNMVESIRHWGLGTRVLAEERRHSLIVTPLGEKLFTRWDPFLEDPASIWLLHWLLTSNPRRAAAWHLTFTCYPHPEFSKNQLVDWILDAVRRHGSKTVPATVARDVDCLVRSYVPAQTDKRSAPEEAFECPLADLGLITGPYDGNVYRFAIGLKRTLPPAVLAFALLDFARHYAPGRMTLSVGECLHSRGSPGQAFKLDENTFVEFIEDIAEVTDGGIQFDDTSGLRQVYLRRPVNQMDLLTRYYEVRRPR